MKTFRKIMMAMFVMACIGTMVSCNEKENEDDSYSAMLVGTWRIDRMVYNGQDMTSMMPNIEITFSSDKTGLMNDGGETENNNFTWAISSSTITVTPRHNQFTFTITSMTANECTFTGNYMNIGEMDLRGTIEVHMVKVNGDTPAEEFPAGTEWGGFSVDTTVVVADTSETGEVDSIPVHYVISLGVKFNKTGHSGTFNVMVHADSYNTEMPMPFTYTYNGSTSEGVISMMTEDGLATANFSINTTDNTLSFVLPEDVQQGFIEEFGLSSLVFHRMR